MNCPLCKNEPMIVLELDEIEIDYCLRCKGIWLDEGELELLLEDAEEKDAVLASCAVRTDIREERIRCPICLKKMDKVTAGTSAEVIIDKCKKNHGIWFDEGELERVISMGTIDNENKVLNLLQDMFAKTSADASRGINSAK